MYLQQIYYRKSAFAINKEGITIKNSTNKIIFECFYYHNLLKKYIFAL